MEIKLKNNSPRSVSEILPIQAFSKNRLILSHLRGLIYIGIFMGKASRDRGIVWSEPYDGMNENSAEFMGGTVSPIQRRGDETIRCY